MKLRTLALTGVLAASITAAGAAPAGAVDPWEDDPVKDQLYRLGVCGRDSPDPTCSKYRPVEDARTTVRNAVEPLPDPPPDLPPDPPPGPPPCHLDDPREPSGGCRPGPERIFIFESVDPERPTTGDNRCEVKLEGATPPDPFGRPDVQYRTTVTCQRALRVLNIEPRLVDVFGGLRGVATPFSCHALVNPCGTSHSARGGGARDPDVYIQQTYLRMVVPESKIDPWVLVAGKSVPGRADSCTAGREEVECLVELEIPATGL